MSAKCKGYHVLRVQLFWAGLSNTVVKMAAAKHLSKFTDLTRADLGNWVQSIAGFCQLISLGQLAHNAIHLLWSGVHINGKLSHSFQVLKKRISKHGTLGDVLMSQTWFSAVYHNQVESCCAHRVDLHCRPDLLYTVTYYINTFLVASVLFGMTVLSVNLCEPCIREHLFYNWKILSLW